MIRKHQTILRYFALLVVTVVATLGLVLGLTFFRYQGEAEARARVQEFNLRSLVVATEVSTTVAEVREIVATATAEEEMFAAETRRRLANGVFLISEGTAELTALQEAAGTETFASTLERAETHAAALSLLATSDIATVAEWQEQLLATDLGMFQLRRLHAIAAEFELQQIEDRINETRLIAAFVVPLALLIGGAVVTRLYSLVHRRLAELDSANEKLTEARLHIEQSRRLDALATLVGGAAHDFNNLLMVIRLQAEVGQARIDPDDPAAETLRRIQTAADQATTTTRQLLSFGRGETPRSEVIELDRHIDALQPVLRGLLRGDIDLEITTADAAGAVSVDPVQLDQVLMNLVINARDAIPGVGRVTISVSAVHLDAARHGVPAGTYCRVRVEDTGAGMSQEVQARAFDPFFTTKGGESGTGLGLSMVHGIVTKSDGHVHLTSTLDVGTRFDLYFPSVEAVAAKPERPSRRKDDGGSETILIIDDEQQIRELLTAGLRERGYRVFAAADAIDALDLRAEIGRQLDLLLTDVVMPGTRGPELVAMLGETYPEMAVIYMSGYVEDAVLDAVFARDVRFVPKPFELEHIAEVVREQLDSRSQARPIRGAGTSIGSD